MGEFNKEEVLKYLEKKRKTYQYRLDKCKSENNNTDAITYEIRLKPVTDLILYLNKVPSIDKQKFIKRVELKRNEYRKQRDIYESRSQAVDATNCEISILPLENLIRQIMVGNLDVEPTEQKENNPVPEKDDGSPRESDRGLAVGHENNTKES